MDAQALYPSLRVEECAKLIFNMVIDSPLKTNNLDWENAAKFLSVEMTENEIISAGLSEWVPKKY